MSRHIPWPVDHIDIPRTADAAKEAASRVSALHRHGFMPKPGYPSLDVQAERLRRLSAWIEQRAFEEAAQAAEKRARARMAQFETSAAEAW
jgi:hypothetical protein